MHHCVVQLDIALYARSRWLVDVFVLGLQSIFWMWGARACIHQIRDTSLSNPHPYSQSDIMDLLRLRYCSPICIYTQQNHCELNCDLKHERFVPFEQRFFGPDLGLFP